jgi:MFS family permease
LSDPDSSFTPIHLGGENPQCRIPEVQSKVSTFLLVMSMITGLLSTVICPRMGHLSDRYGRTRLLAFASIGGLAAELITILAVKFPDVVDYRWLILGSVFDGLTGSFTAGGILAQSYTTDATPPSKRAVSLGFLSACLFMGLAFGPVLAAEFVKLTGSLLSIFYVALGCHTFFVLFVGFVIPDSLSKRRQKLARENWAKEWELRIESMGYWLATAQTINPFEPLRNLWPTGPGTSRRLRLNLAVLGSSEMVIMGTGFAAGACIILYSEYIFGWGNYESSQFVSALSISRVFVLVILSPIVNYFGRVRPAARQRRESGLAPSEKATGPDRLDFWILRASLVAELIGVIGYITAPDERFFFVCGMVTALGGLGAPTIQAAITKSIPADQTGRVLGAIGVLHSLARSLGPVLINGIYAATVKTFPQAFFVLLFVLFFLVLLASFALKPSGNAHHCFRRVFNS